MIQIRCMAVDDEPIALGKLENYIRRIPFLELVALCESPVEAVQIMMEQQVDALFVDINMPDLNGMELVSSLPNPPMVVFTTAYAEYAAESYRIPAVDYLLKPFDFADFQRAASRLLKQAKLSNGTTTTSDEDYLLVKDGYKYVNVPVADILYIQGMRDYVKIYAEGRKPVVVNTSMTQMKEKLPACFLQVHRSWIVNIRKAKEIERMRIVIGEERIPIGDSYKQQFMEFLRLHSLEK
ncbi:LytTR family DNA-binding domain-containing protein [uncultured Bacteroides sp.]|uniref:LytR/AlgR family response regulator transcription factor n=1 Tax=uncultured Bacteroides sp. TaxID=162156 RepID=UPI0025D1921A|nr:LytTR family DNA-binding domain-containing protein [uncultured Bacteroides sp.]